MPAGRSTKLQAVLAHEESHIGRGDFFIQLLAALYRAVFWFSPFAWWLQARLCALAEAASDEAAIQRLDDRATYAEILVDVSRHANSLAIPVAMAKGPDIRWRVDRILGANRERRLGAAAPAGRGAGDPARHLGGGRRPCRHSARRTAACRVTSPLPVNETAVAASRARDRAGAGAAPAKPAARRIAPARSPIRSRKSPTIRARLLNAPDVAVIPALVPLVRQKSSQES